MTCFFCRNLLSRLAQQPSLGLGENRRSGTGAAGAQGDQAGQTGNLVVRFFHARLERRVVEHCVHFAPGQRGDDFTFRQQSVERYSHPDSADNGSMSQAPGVAVFADDSDPFPGKAERQQGCSQMVDLAPEFGVSPHRQRFIDLVPEPESRTAGVQGGTLLNHLAQGRKRTSLEIRLAMENLHHSPQFCRKDNKVLFPASGMPPIIIQIENLCRQPGV